MASAARWEPAAVVLVVAARVASWGSPGAMAAAAVTVEERRAVVATAVLELAVAATVVLVETVVAKAVTASSRGSRCKSNRRHSLRSIHC